MVMNVNKNNDYVKLAISKNPIQMTKVCLIPYTKSSREEKKSHLIKNPVFGIIDERLSNIPKNYPGESFGLKFTPNQSEFFQIIPESVSEPNSFIPI